MERYVDSSDEDSIQKNEGLFELASERAPFFGNKVESLKADSAKHALPNNTILDDQEMKKLLTFILSERKLLIKIAEKTFNFYAQFKGEFEQIEAQSNMTMILMKDLLDYA